MLSVEFELHTNHYSIIFSSVYSVCAVCVSIPVYYIHTVDPHLSGLYLSGSWDYPDTKFPGIAICTLAIWP